MPVVDAINYFDTFLLTMAMTALGAETSIDKFKKAGAKPFILLSGFICGCSAAAISCRDTLPALAITEDERSAPQPTRCVLLSP